MKMKGLVALLEAQSWQKVKNKPDLEKTEFSYQCSGWQRARRFVAIRQVKEFESDSEKWIGGRSPSHSSSGNFCSWSCSWLIFLYILFRLTNPWNSIRSVLHSIFIGHSMWFVYLSDLIAIIPHRTDNFHSFGEKSRLSLHESGDFLLTYLNGERHGVKKKLVKSLKRRKNAGLNRVSW